MEKNLKNYIYNFVCVCVYLNHVAVHRKLTHCKSSILQFKKKIKFPVLPKKKKRKERKENNILCFSIQWMVFSQF